MAEQTSLYCTQTLADGAPCGSPQDKHGEGYGFDHPFRAPSSEVVAFAKTMPLQRAEATFEVTPESLRYYADEAPGHVRNGTFWFDCWGCHLDKAADEIERLVDEKSVLQAENDSLRHLAGCDGTVKVNTYPPIYENCEDAAHGR